MYQAQYGEDYTALFIEDGGSKKIYLTFDEGYEYGYSERILDTLLEKNVQAVFFVTEPYAKTQPELVQRIIDEGHTLGNHSVTHPANGLPSQTLEQQTNEVMENHNYIRENFNYEMRYFRFPAGKFSEQSLAIVNNCNYTSVFWSFAYYDYDVENQPQQGESLQKLMDKLHSGAIYLLHAESETNAAILGQFIDQARAEGYEFAALK
jgi:delta-lactam-biosynthetic de-N-acetylase